jgi:hypothetical protein
VAHREVQELLVRPRGPCRFVIMAVRRGHFQCPSSLHRCMNQRCTSRRMAQRSDGMGESGRAWEPRRVFHSRRGTEETARRRWAAWMRRERPGALLARRGWDGQPGHPPARGTRALRRASFDARNRGSTRPPYEERHERAWRDHLDGLRSLDAGSGEIGCVTQESSDGPCGKKRLPTPLIFLELVV